MQPRAGPARPPLPLPRYPPPPSGVPSGPGISQQIQDCLRCPLIPQPPNRGAPWVFPPARLPYVLPNPPDLGGPGPAFGEGVVSRLWPTAAAPPALARVGLLGLVSEADPYRRVPQEELVIAASSCGGVSFFEGLVLTGAYVVARLVHDWKSTQRSRETWPRWQIRRLVWCDGDWPS